MAKETGDNAQDKKRYIYRKCPTCGVKLHIDEYTCWKCGNRYDFNGNTGKWAEDMIYGSTNPSDAIYSLRLNNVKKCMTCRNTQRGNPCDYSMCFGTGKGRCDNCNRYENTRFMCCQSFQEQERSGGKAGFIAPGVDPMSLFFSKEKRDGEE